MEFLDNFKAVEPIKRTKEVLGRFAQAVGNVVFNHNVQLCESNYYIREHHTDEPVQPQPLSNPAQRFEE